MADAARDAIADRYGTSRTRRFDRRVAWIVGAIAVIAAAVVIAFGSWQQNTVSFVGIGFDLDTANASGSGAYSATAKFEVSGEPGARISCAVEALDTAKATVGWKVVDLPVIEGRTQTVTVKLVTVGPATAVSARSCWEVTG